MWDLGDHATALFGQWRMPGATAVTADAPHSVWKFVEGAMAAEAEAAVATLRPTMAPATRSSARRRLRMRVSVVLAVVRTVVGAVSVIAVPDVVLISVSLIGASAGASAARSG